MFREDEDLAVLFVGDLGDIEYGRRKTVCEVGKGGCLVGKAMGRGLLGAKARGWSPRILSRRRRAMAWEYWLQSLEFEELHSN
jgi:hypothetical protein